MKVRKQDLTLCLLIKVQVLKIATAIYHERARVLFRGNQSMRLTEFFNSKYYKYVLFFYVVLYL